MGTWSDFKNGVGDFLGAADRRNARKFGAQADRQRQQMIDKQAQALDVAAERRTAEQGLLDSQQERFDRTYAPIEQQLGNELAEGPQLEQEAAIAGGRFGNEFDAAIASRERDQRRQGINYRAGSSAQRMQGENDAFNRARGIATAATDARRAEDDSHFLKQNAFFSANGNSLQTRVQQGMATMYGADYNAQNTAANQIGEQAGYSQGVSDRYAAQAGAGINTVLNLGGRAVAAGATGGLSEAAGSLMGGITGAFSGGGESYSGAGLGSGVQSAGIQSTGVTTHATSSPQAQRMSATGQYLNDYTPNQTQAAIKGDTASYYRNNFGS